jgi:hypothetical protein
MWRVSHRPANGSSCRVEILDAVGGRLLFDDASFDTEQRRIAAEIERLGADGDPPNRARDIGASP